MFDRLVAYGCSHTSAYETNDHLLMTDADAFKLQHGLGTFYNAIGRKHPDTWDYDAHLEQQKSNSYANVLAELIGILCVNNSIPGNSLANVLWQLHTDIANNQISTTDLVLIGIPSHLRITHFAPDSTVSLQLGRLEQYPAYNFDLPTMLDYFNREQTTYLHLLYIHSLMLLEKTTLPGQMVILSPDASYYGLFDNILPNEQTPHLPVYFQKTAFNIFQEISNSPLWLDYNNVRLWNAGDRRHAGMHSTKEMHKRYAEKLFKNLKELHHDQFV